MSALGLHFTARLGDFTLAVDFETTERTVLLTGPNGAGKSSLLRAVLGLLPSCTGEIIVDGRCLQDSRAKVSLPPEARQLGYVPQSHALFPHMTVREQLAFALRARTPPFCHSIDEQVERTMADLELTALARRLPYQLSGGQSQRVALGRAVIARPKALLLDEPLAALDPSAKDQVRAFLGRYLSSLDIVVVVVTHELGDAAAWPGQLAVMNHGRLVNWEDGSLLTGTGSSTQ